MYTCSLFRGAIIACGIEGRAFVLQVIATNFRYQRPEAAPTRITHSQTVVGHFLSQLAIATNPLNILLARARCTDKQTDRSKNITSLTQV